MSPHFQAEEKQSSTDKQQEGSGRNMPVQPVAENPVEHILLIKQIARGKVRLVIVERFKGNEDAKQENYWKENPVSDFIIYCI
jgi:hypothetical protein